MAVRLIRKFPVSYCYQVSLLYCEQQPLNYTFNQFWKFTTWQRIIFKIHFLFFLLCLLSGFRSGFRTKILLAFSRRHVQAKSMPHPITAPTDFSPTYIWRTLKIVKHHTVYCLVTTPPPPTTPPMQILSLAPGLEDPQFMQQALKQLSQNND